jgi:hypothetical protein
MGFH